MHETLRYLLEKILVKYSEGEFYQTLLMAKEFYFQKTGKVFEEDEDYESRMASFNDWYVLSYIPEDEKETFFERYSKEHEVSDDVLKAIKETNHSFFEYTGTNFKGLHVLKDILHDKKLILAKTHPTPSLLKGDIFIGRTSFYREENFLFNGLRIMPKDASSILKKEAKKVRKSGDPDREEVFLFLAESYKTKWQHYGHVDVTKIFVFPK